MKISLTFDNGPDSVITPFVLDVLHRQNVAGTFFMVGKNLGGPDVPLLVDRISAEGHQIGNHSFTHSVPLGLCDEATVVSEIDSTQRELTRLGLKTSLFRPFGGGGKLNRELLHRAALEYMATYRMTCVTWNCVPEDWIDPHHWCERALEDVQKRDWSVVVLHDLQNRGMEHLTRFIERAKGLGAVFTHEFPASCVPVKAGQVQWDIAHLMPATAL